MLAICQPFRSRSQPRERSPHFSGQRRHPFHFLVQLVDELQEVVKFGSRFGNSRRKFSDRVEVDARGGCGGCHCLFDKRGHTWGWPETRRKRSHHVDWSRIKGDYKEDTRGKPGTRFKVTGTARSRAIGPTDSPAPFSSEEPSSGFPSHLQSWKLARQWR